MMTQRTIASWLCVYLFHDLPLEPLLINGIAPFASDVIKRGLTDQFFFIRYNEGGPHIRLRFRTKSSEELMQSIVDHFTFFFGKHSVKGIEEQPNRTYQNLLGHNSIVFADYDPELDRYGGEAGMRIAEEQAFFSSKVILDRIMRTPVWNQPAAIRTALQMHIALLHALRASFDEMQILLDRMISHWIHFALPDQNEGDKTTIAKERARLLVERAFGKTFDQEQSRLVEAHKEILSVIDREGEVSSTWIQGWYKNMLSVVDQLRAADESGKLWPPSWDQPDIEVTLEKKKNLFRNVIESYFHMTNNRLGIWNRDEAFLYYLLRESLKRIER